MPEHAAHVLRQGPAGEMPLKAFARIIIGVLIKFTQARQALRSILGEAVPVLSADDVLSDRKQRLMDCVRYINDTYSV